jgi:mannosyltransferase OCH1-like enzyme
MGKRYKVGSRIMIEKKIHYIWFGKEKPEKVLKCIESWRKFLPEYEIIEWNEKNFDLENEMKKCKFLRECYRRKLWAFLSDYVRLKVLYQYGGIYLDTDMEIIKNLDDLLETDFFTGYENDEIISFGILGCIPQHKIIEKMLDFYDNKIWDSDMYIITNILTEILKEEYGDKLFETSGIKIYPKEYFYPYNHDEEFTEKCLTENTYGIHWWGKSWGKNPKVYFLKYKHLPWWKRYPKHLCKLINIYSKKYFTKKV